MVFSEPGHPHNDERHAATDPHDLYLSGMRHVYECYKERTDTFHKNVRWFMAQLYPDRTFDEQLERIWLTEGRLCSIDDEIGKLKDKTCAQHFLRQQFNLMSDATVVGFGGKAKSYLKAIGADHIGAYALAPPGANHKPARPSWDAALDEIRARRAT